MRAFRQPRPQVPNRSAYSEVERVHEFLQLLLDNCRASGAMPKFGGDFSSSINFLMMMMRMRMRMRMLRTIDPAHCFLP